MTFTVVFLTYIYACAFIQIKEYVLSYGQRLCNKVFLKLPWKLFFSKVLSFISTLLTSNPCNIPLDKGCKLIVYKTSRRHPRRPEFVDFMLDYMRKRSSPASSFCSHFHSCMKNSRLFCNLLFLSLETTAKIACYKTNCKIFIGINPFQPNVFRGYRNGTFG